MDDLRLALLQSDPRPGEVAANLGRLDRAAADAAAAGARLLVTPEMFLTGYAIGAAAAAALAEPPGGARESAVAAIAQRHGIAIVVGHPERGDAGAVFNAAVAVGAAGQVLGRHRKTHLYGELDRAMFAAGAGDEPVFAIDGWRVGLLICFDIEFPENARRLADLGAQLIVVPTANMAGFDAVARHVVPTRAYENQLFVAYANFSGRDDVFAYGGASCVAAPDGRVLAQAGDAPCCVHAVLTEAAWADGRALQADMAAARRRRG